MTQSFKRDVILEVRSVYFSQLSKGIKNKYWPILKNIFSEQMRFLLRFLHKPCVSSLCGYFPFKARICCSGVPTWGFDGGAPPVAWIIWVLVQLETMEGQGSTPCSDLPLSDAIGAHAARDDQTIRPANTYEEAFESMLVIGIDHPTYYLQNMLLKLLGIRSRKLYWSVRGGARSFVPPRSSTVGLAKHLVITT